MIIFTETWYTIRGMVLSNQKFSLGYIMLEVSSKIHVEVSVSQLDMEIFFFYFILFKIYMEIFISRAKLKLLSQICVSSFYV